MQVEILVLSTSHVVDIVMGVILFNDIVVAISSL